MSDARYCPSCGAPPADRHRRVCAACDGPLLPVGVPDPREAKVCRACGHAMAGGDRFCAGCGREQGAELPLQLDGHCPACGPGARFERWILDGQHYRDSDQHNIDGCGRCGGLWVSRPTFDAIIRGAEARVREGELPRVEALPRRELNLDRSQVRYLRCPICDAQMARRNFGRISGVVVDECVKHGVYLDAGELTAIRAFVEAGGMRVAAARERAESAREERRKEDQRRHASAARATGMTVEDRRAWTFADLIGSLLDLITIR